MLWHSEWWTPRRVFRACSDTGGRAIPWSPQRKKAVVIKAATKRGLRQPTHTHSHNFPFSFGKKKKSLYICMWECVYILVEHINKSWADTTDLPTTWKDCRWQLSKWRQTTNSQLLLKQVRIISWLFFLFRYSYCFHDMKEKAEVAKVKKTCRKIRTLKAKLWCLVVVLFKQNIHFFSFPEDIVIIALFMTDRNEKYFLFFEQKSAKYIYIQCLVATWKSTELLP